MKSFCKQLNYAFSISQSNVATELRRGGQNYTVSKNIPDIFDCNVKTNYQILIISGTNIPDTTCHQMAV